jgi:peptide chain release factor 1
MNNLQELKEEYKKITDLLSRPERVWDWKQLGEINKRKEEIEKVLEKEKELEKIRNELRQAEQIIKTETDTQLLKLAQQEKESLLQKESELEKEIELLLSKKQGEEEPDSVIIEIRAGAGGDEAALFTANLFNMYSKYANSKNWKLRVLNSHPTDLGGFKEITFEVSGPNVYSKLKYEGGVHRVQRIPATEKSGRIHTSTAAVAVLPKPRKAQITIRPDDLKIDTFRASGPGGQYVNRRETAIRITHLPTGIVVTCQTERNQAQNRENALSILEAKLLELQEKSHKEKIQEKRRTQIGKMERSEKIRTYNFPQNRITDHRIKKTWHNLQEVMEGELDPIIEELEKFYQQNA